MHLSSLILFTLVLLIVLTTLSTCDKTGKVITTRAVTPAATKVLVAVNTSRRKFGIASNVQKKKKKKRQRQKKNLNPRQILWKLPDANQQKIFNDYKAIIFAKIKAHHPHLNRTNLFQPMKYRLQTLHDEISHHYLIKLPHSKYTRAVIRMRKGVSTHANNISINRQIFDNIAAAAAAAEG